jgi:MFS family permease
MPWQGVAAAQKGRDLTMDNDNAQELQPASVESPVGEKKEPEYVPPPSGWRTFLTLWGTQSLSVFGSALTFFTVNIWLVVKEFPNDDQKLQLGLALGAVDIAFGVTTMIVAPFAGAWADRHDRKRTMFVTDLLNGGLSLLLMGLMVTGTLDVWILAMLMIAFAVLTGFHGSAFDTSYAMLVPESKLPRANGMMQTIWSLSGIVSPAIAAGIIALPALARQGVLPEPFGGWLAGLDDGTALAIAIDAATFFIAAAVIWFLRIPSPKRTDLRTEEGKIKKSIWADVKEGALYIWRRRPMLWLLGTFTAANFFLAIGVLIPLLVKFNLQPDWASKGFTYESAFAFVSTLFAIGGVAGGVFISVWGGLKRRRIYGVVIPIMIAGVAQIVFGLSPWIYLTAAMGIILDGMIPIMNAHSQSIWQGQTPKELQGRVFSVRRVIAQFSWPISAAIASWLGGLYNPGLIVALMGGMLVVFCIGQLFNPVLKRVEDKAYLESLAAEAEAQAARRAGERKESKGASAWGWRRAGNYLLLAAGLWLLLAAGFWLLVAGNW